MFAICITGEYGCDSQRDCCRRFCVKLSGRRSADSQCKKKFSRDKGRANDPAVKERYILSEIEKSGRTITYVAEIPVTEQELKALEIMRKLSYGEVRTIIQNSEIVLIEKKETIKT